MTLSNDIAGTCATAALVLEKILARETVTPFELQRSIADLKKASAQMLRVSERVKKATEQLKEGTFKGVEHID